MKCNYFLLVHELVFIIFFSSPNLWLPLLLPLLLLLPPILFLFLPPFRLHLFSNRSTSSQALPISNCSPANSYIDSSDTDSALSNANYPSPQPSTSFSSPLLLTKDGELLYLQVPLKRHLLFWKKCTKAPRLQQ